MERERERAIGKDLKERGERRKEEEVEGEVKAGRSPVPEVETVMIRVVSLMKYPL